jgi:hypothetical protein
MIGMSLWMSKRFALWFAENALPQGAMHFLPLGGNCHSKRQLARIVLFKALEVKRENEE